MAATMPARWFRRLGSNGGDDDDGLAASTAEPVLATLQINVAIALLLWAVFEGCRHIRSIYAKRLKSVPHRTPPAPGDGFFAWIPAAVRVGEKETLRMVGLDGYMLLRYVRTCYRLCLFCSFWGLAVLVPVYWTGNPKHQIEGFFKTTLANTAPGSYRLWAAAVFAYLFSGYFMNLMYKEYKHFVKLRQNFLAHGDPDVPTQTLYTVMVENIPPQFRTPKALREFFESVFPGQVYSVNICLELTELEKLVAARQKVRDELEKAIAYEKATGERLEIKVPSDDIFASCTPNREKCDAQTYYREKLDELNRRVSELQLEYARRSLREVDGAQLIESRSERLITNLRKQLKTKGSSSSSSSAKDATAPLLEHDNLGELGPLDDGDDRQQQARGEEGNEEDEAGEAAGNNNGEGAGGVHSRVLAAAKDATLAVAGTAIGTVHKVTRHALKGVGQVTRQLELLTVGADYMLSSTAFVTFYSRVAAVSSYQLLLTPDAVRMEVTPGRSALDVIWPNVSLPMTQISARLRVTNFIVLLGGLFWSAVIATIQAWASMSSLSEWIPGLDRLQGSFLYDVLSGYLPALALLILLNLLPTIFQWLAVTYEGAKLHSDVQQTVMTRYFYFQVVNIYITVTAGSLWDSINSFAHSDASAVLANLSQSVLSVAIYFMNVMIVKILSGLPMRLLRLWPLLYLGATRLVTDKKKLTRRQLRSGPFADPEMAYGWEYPELLMVLMIVLTYAVIAPVLMPFGVAFFGIIYVIYKYQLLYIYVPKYQSGGSFFFPVFKRSMISLLAATITLMGYMGLKEGVAQVSFLAPLPVIIYYFWNWVENTVSGPLKYLSLQTAVEIDKEQRERRENGEPTEQDTFDAHMYDQPSLTEPPQEPEEYRVNPLVSTSSTGVEMRDEDVELGTAVPENAPILSQASNAHYGTSSDRL